jgi:hypothetical protein
LVSQALEGGIQARGAHGRRPHIHAATLLAEIEWHTQKPDF